MVRYIIFPWLERRPFVCLRAKKWGGAQIFKTYIETEHAFSNKELLSGDLKIGVADVISEILTKLQKRIQPSVGVRYKAYSC